MTSLHMAGMQKILELWFGYDLDSFAKAESSNLLILCFFFFE